MVTSEDVTSSHDCDYVTLNMLARLGSSHLNSKLKRHSLIHRHGGQVKSKVRFLLLAYIRPLLPDARRTLIVRMISTAQTGYFYTTQRLRLGPRLAAVKYDPRGVSHLSFQTA